MSFFVTGTDTGVGKTHTIVQLLRLLQKSAKSCIGFKPICCGDRQDAERLWHACDHAVDLDEINPVWLKIPAAPLIAAEVENVTIDIEQIIKAFRSLQNRFELVLVEGVGGWLVPICAASNASGAYFVSDLAAELKLPVLIVALNRLGCLNHTALTEEAVRQRGLRCAGVVFNALRATDDVAVQTNATVLRRLLRSPLLTGLTEEFGELPPVWRQVLGAERAGELSDK